jgi:hypothetical protein
MNSPVGIPARKCVEASLRDLGREVFTSGNIAHELTFPLVLTALSKTPLLQYATAFIFGNWMSN